MVNAQCESAQFNSIVFIRNITFPYISGRNAAVFKDVSKSTNPALAINVVDGIQACSSTNVQSSNTSVILDLSFEVKIRRIVVYSSGEIFKSFLSSKKEEAHPLPLYIYFKTFVYSPAFAAYAYWQMLLYDLVLFFFLFLRQFSN